ncbi:MAG: prephenate dehydrogenase, partial [Streptosporangiaceae bacterium]
MTGQGAAEIDGQGPVSVVVIGTGLIGTSVALALRAGGAQLWLADQDADALALAVGLGAGRPLPAA